MSHTEKLSVLLNQYHTLCNYCDTLFESVRQAYPREIHCAEGCADCCSLETVVPLEAYVIALFLKDSSRRDDALEKIPQDHHCLFLLHETQACSIYPVRPLICRTHGLPTRYPEQPGIDICPLNFPNHPDALPVEEQYILDAGIITTNLMKLNLAFCLLHGKPESAEHRISLANLWRGDDHYSSVFRKDSRRLAESGASSL